MKESYMRTEAEKKLDLEKSSDRSRDLEEEQKAWERVRTAGYEETAFKDAFLGSKTYP